MQLMLQCHGLPPLPLAPIGLLAISNENRYNSLQITTGADGNKAVRREREYRVANTWLDLRNDAAVCGYWSRMQCARAWMSYDDFFRNPFVRTRSALVLFTCLIAETPFVTLCQCISSWIRIDTATYLCFSKRKLLTISGRFELQKKMLKINPGNPEFWHEKKGFGMKLVHDSNYLAK